MRPAPFAYVRPITLAAAIAALDEDPGARPIAGGQSLIPWLAMRRLRPSALVDIIRIPGLDRLEVSDGDLVIGACVRQRQLERDPLAGAAIPLLVAAVREIGYPQTRSQGTVGGSLAHLDPRAELAVVALALDAIIELDGPHGMRTSTFEALALGPFRSDVRAGELIVAIRMGIPEPPARWSFHEIARRPNDQAEAIAAGVLDGRSVRIAVGALDGPPVRLAALERAVADGDVRPGDIRMAAAAALAGVALESDPTIGPREHRLAVAETCLSRVLADLLAPTGARP